MASNSDWFEPDEIQAARKAPKVRARAKGQCSCGKIAMEIDVPAVWAWHDHSAASRRAHGAAYATYVGSWKSKFRITKGEKSVVRYKDSKTGTVRSFCGNCGTPVMYERPRAPKMVNIPRALFDGRTGREPRYHLNIDQIADWIFTGSRLVPLKNYRGVVWERPKPKKKQDNGGA